MMMEHLHHTWKINRFLLLAMKQDQKHKLAQRSQHSFILFSLSFFSFFFPFLFFYRKKIISMCTPIRQQAPYVINVMTIASQITAQPCNSLLCYNDLTIKCIIPLSNKIRKTALQKRKCPKISSSSASIYISICIYTYTQSQRYTRLCGKNIMFFPQSNTHIRTSSPGAYIYTIVFCCVCFFFLFRKKN